MKKTILSAMLGMALTANADNTQVVKIGGQTVQQTLTTITFSGDNLILTYADGTTQTVDMEDVSIAFTFADAMKALDAATSKDAPVEFFDMSGRQLRKAPQKGAYLMKKDNKVVKLINKK